MRQRGGMVSRRSVRRLVLTAVGSLAMAATVPGTFVPAGATLATAKVPPAIVAAGRDRLIAIGDLPGHWTPSAYGSGTQGESSGAAGGCGIAEPGVVQSHPFIEGPYFDQKGSSAEIQEEVDIFPNGRQATTDMRFSAKTAFQQCLVQSFNQKKATLAKDFGQGATVGTITSQSIPVSQFGQGAVDVRVTIPINLGGVTSDFTQDDVVIVQGKYEAVVDESDYPTPIPAALQSRIDQVVAGRL
jgi:hypothetical protein